MVASESAFSTRGWVLDQYRTKLVPSTVEALIFTKDWLQDSRSLINISSDDDEEADQEEID